MEVGGGRGGPDPFFGPLVLAPGSGPGNASPGKGGVSRGNKEGCDRGRSLGLRSGASNLFGSMWSRYLIVVT